MKLLDCVAYFIYRNKKMADSKVHTMADIVKAFQQDGIAPRIGSVEARPRNLKSVVFTVNDDRMPVPVVLIAGATSVHVQRLKWHSRRTVYRHPISGHSYMTIRREIGDTVSRIIVSVSGEEALGDVAIGLEDIC